jgi:hypothetical protein
MMPNRVFEVFCEWDDEAKLWFVASSNVPGLSAEASTVEAMKELLVRRVPELVELNLPECRARRGDHAPLDLLIHQKEMLRIGC